MLMNGCATTQSYTRSFGKMDGKEHQAFMLFANDLRSQVEEKYECPGIVGEVLREIWNSDEEKRIHYLELVPNYIGEHDCGKRRRAYYPPPIPDNPFRVMNKNDLY